MSTRDVLKEMVVLLAMKGCDSISGLRIISKKSVR